MACKWRRLWIRLIAPTLFHLYAEVLLDESTLLLHLALGAGLCHPGPQASRDLTVLAIIQVLNTL